MADPNQRAELDRLRKMKRLRELEAKAGAGQPNEVRQPGLGITPAQQYQRPAREMAPNPIDDVRIPAVINQIDDVLIADLQERARQNPAPNGKRNEVRRGPDGRPYLAQLTNDPRTLPKPDPFLAALDKSAPVFERSAAMINGTSFGLADEIAGLAGDEYGKQGLRYNLKAARAKRPLETMGIEMLSALPSGLIGARAASPVINLSQRPMLGGAIGGGVYGYGDAGKDSKFAKHAT